MIYLASASPRRRELLNQIGIEFELLSVDVDESVEIDEAPHDYVTRVAALKAQAGVAVAQQQWPILAADTIVILDGEVLLKPADQQAAIATLSKLSGHTHEVKTAIAIAFGGKVFNEVVTTQVTMRPIDEAEMLSYWQSGEPADKAGSYGIQGLGGKFVESINGSYSAVVGLPLMETERLLASVKRSAML
ncbi:MAG: septum formation protein [Phenylobacterium sp.]|jgi:septum formation protein